MMFAEHVRQYDNNVFELQRTTVTDCIQSISNTDIRASGLTEQQMAEGVTQRQCEDGCYRLSSCVR